jgi:hypothetical protein
VKTMSNDHASCGQSLLGMRGTTVLEIFSSDCDCSDHGGLVRNGDQDTVNQMVSMIRSDASHQQILAALSENSANDDQAAQVLEIFSSDCDCSDHGPLGQPGHRWRSSQTRLPEFQTSDRLAEELFITEAFSNSY